MEETNYNTKYQQQNQATNPSKFYSHFLYKALVVTIFLVILLLFPSQAPEFINQTLNTRGWEFLHLIFVGIAVSYGLFSRRNDEAEKDNNNLSKFDNAQSYVSRFLQVSSVFDDEADSPSRSDGSTIQTWNNQCYRNEPVVVVADENSVLNQEQRGASSRIGEKPLLLPVRSLKSRVLEADGNETSKESSSSGVFASISRSSSNLGSKRISSNSVKSRNGEFGSSHHQDLEEKLKDNVVLPSPIPWRSRSGRMEMKETKEENDSPHMYAPFPSMEEPEFNKSFRSKVSRSTRPNSTNSSPKLSPSPSLSSPRKLSPSPSFAAEAEGKSAEDFVRKKSFYRSPPTPPPPPPPLPQLIRKTQSMKPSSGATNGGDKILGEKDLKRSYTSQTKELNRGGGFSIPTSVRTTRNQDSYPGKEFDDMINTKSEKRFNEGRKTVGFDQSSFKTERLNRDRVTFMSQPSFREYPKEENEEFVEKLVSESEEDLETEDEDDDDIVGNCFVSGTGTGTGTAASSNNEEAASSTASDGGPDVDKKADEFIAKFREQIRLQRIESIKRSSGQISRKASR